MNLATRISDQVRGLVTFLRKPTQGALYLYFPFPYLKPQLALPAKQSAPLQQMPQLMGSTFRSEVTKNLGFHPPLRAMHHGAFFATRFS